MHPDEESKHLQRRIKELTDKGHLPPALLELVAEVYAMQLAAREEAVVAAPPAEEMPDWDRRVQGVPLVERRNFPYDPTQALTLFGRLLELLATQEEPLGAAARTIAAAVAAGELDPGVAFRKYLEEDASLVEAWAARTPQAPRTLAFLVQSALMPSLAAAAAAMTPTLKEYDAWSHGHCPACGSAPLMGSLEEKEGFRHFCCSFCQTLYKTKRLGCPICAEQDFDKLRFYLVEDEPGFRVDVCNTCRRYIKVADYRNLDRRFLPLLDDLASLPLDILATKKGYTRATLSGWGF